MRVWTTDQSAELYGIQNWGKEFLRIDEQGHLVVAPDTAGGKSVDLRLLVDDLQARGVASVPVAALPDILRSQLKRLAEAFHSAIREYGFRGGIVGSTP
ncbi:MAG: hypothetical protein IPK67_19705 [Planctomycetes bacterium]|nr:hypothetical protein [Planctomycetota bacterium]